MLKYFKILIVCFVLILSGCAQFPSGGSSAGGRRLIVTFRVNGRLDPSVGSYFFLINTEPFNPGSTNGNAPIPIVGGSTWGNGIAAGRYNYFILWESGRGYSLFRVNPDTEQNIQEIGRPVNSIEPDPAAINAVFQFELPLTLIPPAIPSGQTAPPPVPEIRFNFIATDKWQGLGNSSVKRWDALGNALIGNFNKPITLDIQQDRIANNTDHNPDPSNPEPASDVVQSDLNGNVTNVTVPFLDIIDWQVEVRS